MSALDDLLKVVHDESFSQDMYDLGEQSAAELLALRERVAKLEKVADGLAEIVEYDTGDARHGLQSLAKARLAEYEELKETK